MTLKISQLMGMDVYTDTAQYVGKVFDVIIDLQKGEVVRLTLEPIKVTSKEDAKRVFREKTVLYKSVKAAGKILIISPSAAEETAEEEAPAGEKPQAAPYSYRYRRGMAPI
ncbi:MAG: PRC-barrel domain-containing protein [Candidatus Micrarchaeota archaeon]|nr:PRC-barrel domain-containing protein [Candidatus Micrarchaeota archaeon]